MGRLRKFILPVFMVCALVMSLLGAGVAAGVPYNLLDDFIEIDTSSRLTVTNDRLTYTNLYISDQAWLKKYGTWNGDFNFQFAINCTNSLVIGGAFSLFELSNETANYDARDYEYGRKDEMQRITFTVSANKPAMYVSEITTGGTLEQSALILMNWQTEYYCKFYRIDGYGDYGKLVLEVYTDPAMTILQGTTSSLCLERQNFTRINIINGWGYGINYPLSGYIEDVTFSEVVPPSCTTDNATNIVYDPYLEMWGAQCNGTVVSDGSDDCTAGFYYRVDGAPEWSYINVLGTYETGESYSAELIYLEEGTTYEYFTRITNDGGIDDGDVIEFTTSGSLDVPLIMTYSYPIEYDGEGGVTLWGKVLNDNGANVTAWFQYKLPEAENWTDSANVTNKVTGDDFSISISDIPERTIYSFRAAGQNTEGNGYGAVGSIHWIFTEDAVLEVDPVLTVTSTTIKLTGTVTDSGNDEDVSCWPQYRVLGSGTWIDYRSYTAMLAENESAEWTISNLTPNTQYEIRLYGWNWDYINFSARYTESEPVTGTTSTIINTPQMEISDYGYLNHYACYVFGDVVNDGGEAVDVWFQFRQAGVEAWTSNAGTGSGTINYDVESGYTVTHYINMTYGKNYQIRMVGENSRGTSYSDPVDYFHVEPGDTTTPEPSNLVPGLNSFLGQFGLDSEGGHLLFIIICMVFVSLALILSPGRRLEEMARYTVPIALGVDCLIFVFGLIIGYIPGLVTVGVIIAAAGTIAVFVVKLFRGRGGSVAV